MTAILFLFIIKHFICDFILQPPYMYLNKGKFAHPGGMAHATVHGTATAIICYAYPTFLTAALIDGVVHYFIDWGKVNIAKRMGWKPDNSEYYWYLLGLDQMLHYLTYAGVITWVL